MFLSNAWSFSCSSSVYVEGDIETRVYNDAINGEVKNIPEICVRRDGKSSCMQFFSISVFFYKRQFLILSLQMLLFSFFYGDVSSSTFIHMHRLHLALSIYFSHQSNWRISSLIYLKYCGSLNSVATQHV